MRLPISRIVTASEDKTARVWDAANATAIASLAEHELGVWSSSFSPDGSRIATASRDRTVRIWDATTYKTTAVLRGLGQDSPTAAFSPDGSRVVTTSTGRTGRIWDVAGGKEVAQLGVGNFEAFSPDWKRLVEVEFAQARVRDAATLREIAVLAGHDQAIWSAAFSPDGARIVTASEDRTSRVWDAATGRELGVLRAVGGLRGQIRGTVWLEAAAIGIIGLVLGLLTGAVLLYYELQAIEHDISGMPFAYEFPWGIAAALVPVILLAALGAAILPAESAVRGSLVEALEYE